MSTTTGSRPRITTVPHTVDTRALLADTDRCVKCALCLPVCPTYETHRIETRSPRGRVSVIQGLATGQITPQEAAPALDSCLACRACESVCPAKVPYGSILDRARTLMADGAPRRLDHRLAKLFRSTLAVQWLAALTRLTGWLPLPRRLARLRAMTVAPRPALTNVDTTGERGPLYLATGCVTHAFDKTANESLANLFRACGFDVQNLHGCCGALAQHGGRPKLATQQWRTLAAGLTHTDAPIVHAASGCAAALRDAGDSPSAGFGDRVVDPFELLLRSGIKAHLNSAAKHYVHVALHRPCTQRNVLGGGPALRELLDALGVPVTELEGAGCCGAAGTHMLTHKETAQALASRMLKPLRDGAKADVLLSANIGCAWHLRGALMNDQRDVRVEHPAVFLAGFLSTQSEVSV